MKNTTKASNLNTAVRKTAAKRALHPEGYGALRGQFEVRPGLDLTNRAGGNAHAHRTARSIRPRRLGQF